MIVKRVGALSAGIMWAAIYGLFGLIVGGCISLYWLLQGFRGGTSGALNDLFTWSLFGIGAVLLLPIFYSIIGLIIGLLIAVLYNWSAKFIGGIEIELE